MYPQQLCLAPLCRVCAPGHLDDVALEHVLDLLTDASLDELMGRWGFERTGDICEWIEPAFERGRGGRRGLGRAGETGSNAAAVGVSDDNDMFNAKMDDGVSQNRKNVIIVEVDLAGHEGDS